MLPSGGKAHLRSAHVARHGREILDTEAPKATETDRLVRMEGANGHLATNVDLANFDTRPTTWLAGLFLREFVSLYLYHLDDPSKKRK